METDEWAKRFLGMLRLTVSEEQNSSREWQGVPSALCITMCIWTQLPWE